MTGWRKRQVVEMALEALERIDSKCFAPPDFDDATIQEIAQQAITAIKETLAQSEQEPYCYTYTENGEEYFAPPKAYVPDDAKPLYTSPPAQRTEERNFCPRCGKRAGDYIHTCTPPQEKYTYGTPLMDAIKGKP